MTNPAAAIRMLITYAICIPLAIFVGYLLCNPLDFTTLGFFGLVAVLLASPLIIKYHYPLLIFAMSAPIFCFFLKGGPPLWQVATLLSLGVAIIERTISNDRRFISVPVIIWPLVFTIGMAVLTAQLTGGIGLNALGSEVTGGKKYIALFIGIAAFFALCSRGIPKHQRNFYIGLFYLPAILKVVSDLFPYLPPPLNYVNLLIPPSGLALTGEQLRFGAFAGAAGAVVYFMLARYGLRGVLDLQRPMRFLFFGLIFALTLFGGFRSVFVGFGLLFACLFFFEGLHRTRLIIILMMGVTLSTVFLVGFSDKLPYSFQRALTVLPLKLDPVAVADAEGSKKWREDMWRDTWPKVPSYLLLGKGYALTAEDREMMGGGQFANTMAARLDQSQQSLAISMDYHNGPLSTLMPFGIWGAISYIWFTLAGLWVLSRNYRYGDADLKNVNRFLFVTSLVGVFSFFFIFGAYSEAIADFAKVVGLSVALNWGVCRPHQTTSNQVQRFRTFSPRQPAPQAQPT